MPDKKSFLLRIAPEIYDALAGWAGEELRSMNGQVEFLLRKALMEAGRLPRQPRERPVREESPRRRTPAGRGATALKSPGKNDSS